jgi:HEAT repeat protein
VRFRRSLIQAGLLLRLKARVGDQEPDVISECLTGILELAGEQGLPFVAEFLNVEHESVQHAALLALGSSRKPAAFEILKQFAEKCSERFHEVAYTALALLRLPAATDYLLSLLADKSRGAAALDALAVHRYDQRVREQAAAEVAKSGDKKLQAQFEKRFRAAG